MYANKPQIQENLHYETLYNLLIDEIYQKIVQKLK